LNINNSTLIQPVILSGGSGTRLWPLSRKQYPKQYLPLVDDNTMLQETILRLNGLDNLVDPIIICNVDHRFIVAEQCQNIDIQNPTILLEPVGCNTAPAIAAAAIQSLKIKDSNHLDQNIILLVLSADHVIQDISAFHKAINIATKQAKDGKLVTFGVVPTDANTGYGYIRKANSVDDVFEVKEFVEKPNQKTADLFIKTNDYLWNSGMFIFKANTLINELYAHSPEIAKAARHAISNAEEDLDFVRMSPFDFNFKVDNSKLSIDYALMEKSNNVVVVQLDAQWNDIGSWSALYDIGQKDNNSNVIEGDTVVKDTTNTYINSSNRLVVTLGVDNLIIVDTPDVSFVANKDNVQEVKAIVESLHIKNREEVKSHRKVYRPWGWYDCIELGKHFQVKRLYINTGAKLSLQMHRKRAEHWVVVNGTATAINADKVLTLTQGESTYIPVGVKHSLENKTNEPLEIIEVQSGAYLGEDDIVRFEDIYGRIKEND